MVLVDGQGTALGLHVDAASPAEVTLREPTLRSVRVGRPHRAGRPRQRPDRLLADRGYDSNPLRAVLAARQIEPIIPARSNNRQATHQDERRLRRYRRRWIVELTHLFFNFCAHLLTEDGYLLHKYNADGSKVATLKRDCVLGICGSG